MAILSSPLFNAQQRLDLEDLNQLISGFRTDARLWVRQFFNTENMIIKGFQCDASINQTELQVDIISAGSPESATFILAGREFDSTTGQIVESPSDFSWFTVESSQVNTSTGPAIRLTAEIPTTFRPLRGTTRLYAYVRLLNSQGTPITKAFWDPSANSGAGAEFNQSVNTANDLAIAIEVVNAPITNTADLLGRIPLATLTVDPGGQIRSVVDTRALFFKKAEDFAFSTDAKLSLETTNVLTNAEIAGLAGQTNILDFRLDEEVFIVDLNATTPGAGSTEAMYQAVNGGVRLRGKIVAVPAAGGAVTIQVDDLRDVNKALITENDAWAENVKPRASIVIGSETMATRMIETMTNRYNIDDKNITSLYKMFQSLQTEIAKIKGTDYWYESPLGSIHDTLRQSNSVIIGELENARYIWNGAELSITTVPFHFGTITVTTQPVSGNTLTISGGSAVTLTAVTSGTPGSAEFLVGSDTADTARNIAARITSNKPALLTTVSGNIITVSTAFANVDQLTAFAQGGTPTSTAFTFGAITTGGSGDNLAAIRIFGEGPKFFLPRHDAATTFIAGSVMGAISIPQGHLAYVKLPDFDDPSFDDSRNYSYRGIVNTPVPITTEFINANELNDDALNVPNEVTNSAFGRILVAPIERYIDDGRHFWIAFHEDSGANNLFIRGIGQIGQAEEVPIGEGVTDNTLAYIGAPSESDSTPSYPSVATIGAFTGSGAFVTNSTKSNLNTSIVAANENLTLAISDLNLVATSTKDATIQDKDMRIVGGGTVAFTSSGNGQNQAASLSFEVSNPAFLSIPGLANNINQLPSLITFTSTTGAADQVASIPVRRNGTTTTVHTVTISDTASYAPSRDKVVIARRLGAACYVGVNGSMRYLAGESAPLDGNLSLFGFVGGQIPLQLRLAPDNMPTGGIGASVADAETEFNISSDGEKQSLNLSITGDDGSSRIMRFPGASLDFTNGRILRPGTASTNYLGRATGAEGTEFSTITLGALEEVWYAISVEADSTIKAAGVDPGGTGALATEIRAEDVGKVLGRIVVSAGEKETIANGATSASFGAGTPIGQIKIQSDNAMPTPELIAVNAANIIQLGASGGGGGGGAGDASQSINDFINRLNLSTFNYFTPIVGSVFSTRNQIDEANSTSGIVIGSNGIQVLSGVVLQSNQLLDEEYLGENIDGIQLVEIDAEWGVDNDGSQRIDPNAIWEIRKQDTDAFTPVTTALAAIVQGYIDNTGNLRGTNLTNISPVVANNNIFFAENHGLETGQRVRFTLGNILGSDLQNPDGGDATATTNYYIHRISSQAFSLHNTRAIADAGTSRLTITSALAPVGFIANLPAGVLPRVGTTNAVRGTHTFTSTVSPASNLNIRIKVTGDSQAATRSQSDDGLLLGFAMFYDQDGADVDSVPRTLDNVAEILRSNHLSNTETTTAGYGVAGRGIVLKDTAGVDTELSIGSNDKIRLDGVELSTGHIIEDGAGTDLAERLNIQFIDNNVFDNSGNDRIIVTPRRAHRGTSQLQSALRNPATARTSGANGVQETFSWTCPSDVVEIYLEVTGGGSGGSTNAANGGNGNSGGAGAYYQGWHTVVPGNAYVVRVGQGGGDTNANTGFRGQRNGAASDFSGNIDGNASGSIISGGGSASTAGTFTITGFSGDTPQLSGNGGQSNNPHFHIGLAGWNTVSWRTDGAGGTGGSGGSNYRAVGATGVGGGGGGAGGAGYDVGTSPPNTAGEGGGGGRGGIRVSWYSNISNGTTNPIT